MVTRAFLTLTLVVALFSAFSLPVLANDTHDCTHEMTIASLRDCVTHHVQDQGLLTSLQAKLDAAQAALVRGQPDVSINLLNAFINAVEAQSGKQIEQEHADHMVTHASHVIEALSQ